MVPVYLDWDNDWRWDRVMALSLTSPEAIPELGLAYLVKNEVDTVDNSSGSLKPGDEIVDVNFVYAKPEGGTQESGWVTSRTRFSRTSSGTDFRSFAISSGMGSGARCTRNRRCRITGPRTGVPS